MIQWLQCEFAEIRGFLLLLWLLPFTEACATSNNNNGNGNGVDERGDVESVQRVQNVCRQLFIYLSNYFMCLRACVHVCLYE